jgi:SAM-dependent methyltransferase
MATTLTAQDQEYVPARWETVACPFCGEARARPFERFGYLHRYTYVQCVSCGLAYQSPRPAYTDDFVQTAYEVYSTDVSSFQESEELTEKGKVVYREYAHNLSEIEGYVGRPGRLLEIGCNTGFFCKVAKDRGWHPVGVEISRTMAELAHRTYGIETRAGDWMRMEFDQPFHAIYCSHVIEHVPDPRAWMERFRRVLAPGGVVCLSVPNMQSIDRKFKRGLKRLGLRKDKWAKWRTPDHLYEPCERSMLRFVDSCGFELLRQYTYPSEWLGDAGLAHRLMHFHLRWGAKARFYLRPRAK